jgi:hypothetical protein
MPFQIEVLGNYDTHQDVMSVFERSIRPIQVETMQVTGSQDELILKVAAKTYYQPEKQLNIKNEAVQ